MDGPRLNVGKFERSNVPTFQPANIFRLLRHAAATGAENMAVDEAISQAIAARLVPPTLRFYGWAPPCVSLGRNQAILHTDELTYSIIAPPDHPLMAGLVLDSYLRISHGLVAGLRRLGIDAEEAPGTNRAGPDVSAACFEVPSAYEILAGGRKILGSAQARRAHSVLQHGSLPLAGDLTRVVECLAFGEETGREALRASLAGHAATAEEVAGRPVSYEEAMEAMIAGMAEALSIDLEKGELSPQERAWTAELVAERYGNPEWTRRV